MTASEYEIKLNVFEGPMDLLVHLIKKNDVDIYDIPISDITSQYLEYIQWMESMNIDFAGDFLLMASTLMQIKSRMLLPKRHDDAEDEDPRMELVRPLLEYIQLKTAGEKLLERNLLDEDTFKRTPEEPADAPTTEDGVLKIGLFELVEAFRNIMEKNYDDHVVDFTAETITVKERIIEIVDILEAKGSVTLNELFEKSAEKTIMIVSFLAILEMCKLNLVEVAQHTQSGIIRIFYQ